MMSICAAVQCMHRYTATRELRVANLFVRLHLYVYRTKSPACILAEGRPWRRRRCVHSLNVTAIIVN